MSDNEDPIIETSSEDKNRKERSGEKFQRTSLLKAFGIPPLVGNTTGKGAETTHNISQGSTELFSEGFEDGEYQDTFEIDKQQSDTSIEVSEQRPKNGAKSLEIYVGSTGEGDIALQRDISVQNDQLVYTAWVYPNSERHNIHFVLRGPTGSADISFNAAQHIIYRTDRRDEIKAEERDGFGNPILKRNPDVNEWYQISITTHPSENVVDVQVKDTNGNEWERTEIPATVDFDEVRFSGTDYNGNFTFFVDDISLRKTPGESDELAQFSFEGAEAGDSSPPNPWRLRSDAGISEITTENTTDGSKAFRMASFRSDLDRTEALLAVDLSDVSTLLVDAYVAVKNASYGDVKLWIDERGTHGIKQLDSDDASEDVQYRDVPLDLSQFSGEHQILLYVRGDGNDVYWDNIRLLDENGELLPRSNVLPDDDASKPTAEFSYSPIQPYTGQEVNFDAVPAVPDAEIESYEWDMDSDSEIEITGKSVTHVFDGAGEKTVTLRITDSNGNHASTDQTIDVIPFDEDTNNNTVDDGSLSDATVEATVTIDGQEYYVLRDLPDESSGTYAYTTTGFELLEPDLAADVAVSHEFCDAYLFDSKERLEYTNEQHAKFDNIEELARTADLLTQLSGALALYSISPLSAATQVAESLGTIVNWASHELTDPYQQQYMKMAATSSTIDWANEEVPDPGGSLLELSADGIEILKLSLQASEVTQGVREVAKVVPTVVDVLRQSDSVVTDVDPNTVSSVDDLRNAGYTALAGLAVSAAVDTVGNIAEVQAKSAALGGGSAGARRPILNEIINLENRIQEFRIGTAGILRMQALRQVDYQLEAAAWEGINTLYQNLSDGLLGPGYDAVFGAADFARKAAQNAEAWRNLSFYTMKGTGEHLKRGLDHYERSLNKAEFGEQTAIRYP